MAKTTIYLNKEAEEIYKVAKEYAGDNLSAVIVQGLKLYVEKMDTMTKGMEEVIIFEGTRYLENGASQGKNLKFIGLRLAGVCVNEFYDNGTKDVFELYLTRKGKFLVSVSSTDGAEIIEKCFYDVHNTFSEVSAKGYPEFLIKEASKNMPEIACEELDV